MSIVLSAYSKDSFKEYLLPSVNNSDYSIVLQSDYFNLSKDLRIDLEILDNCWFIKKSIAYSINFDAHKGYLLKNKDIIKLVTKNNEEVTIIVKDVAKSFVPFVKYKLSNISEITIGKDESCDIRYNYLNMISKNHAKIVRNANGFKIVNYSPNCIYVNSLNITEETQLKFGSYINILGLHIVFLGDMIAIDIENSNAIVSKKLKKYSLIDEETMFLDFDNGKSVGKKIYHRAPRNYEKINEETIEIEAPPQLNQTKKQSVLMAIGPSATMALPMLLGCMMMIYSSQDNAGSSSLYMYSGLVMALSSALVGIIWALVNIKMQKKEDNEREIHRLTAYKEYLVEKTDEIKEKYEIAEKKLHATYPSSSECLSFDDDFGRLWNRNTTHKDFLQHRLGLGNTPFSLKMEIPKKKFVLYKDELTEKPQFIKENYEILFNVPILLNLYKEKLIGIVGGDKKQGALEIARALSAQIIANNCYTDVKLGYIFNSETNCQDWDFVKWIPHVWSEDKKTRFFASDREEASDVFYELTKVFRTRDENKTNNNDETIPKPYYIIFITDPSLLSGELFSKYVFDEKNNLGLTTILLTERYEELPNNCKFIIENTPEFQGMYNVYDDESEKQIINFDNVSKDELNKFSRRIASLQVLEIEEGGDIPSSITFFEMMKINSLEDLNVKELWAKNRIYENIKGLIGEKAGGVPCYLDVHEKYHGPHGLVAGTTGSGKSETLQTYMLSLAVNYSPDDIGFFIIDYKGGGMANLFDGLPHMVGQISNLSGNQVKRAMISIKSENRRRQRVFSENGVNNINAYTKLYKNNETTLPVPHLFIVIDEFAELKREEPDFMRELISVAQVGRSLGVHLILATQKPSGTVDDNIWSNSKFRLCLRVQDQQDSKDMLHKPDAAYITQAGRCYLQVGNDEVYELFQSGFSGAVYDESMVSGNADIAKLITNTGKTEMTGNSVKQSRKKRAEILWIETLISCLQESINESKIGLLSCLESDTKMSKLISSLYLNIKKNNIDYPESKYNSIRLEEFIKLYINSVSEQGDLSIAETLLITASKNNIKLPQSKEKTQLDAVKEYLADMAKENGYNHKLQLWMPVLPENIYLDEFEEFNKTKYDGEKWIKTKNNWDLGIIIGKMDDPENQNQMPLKIDFSVDGNIAVLGTIVCGKSTMLQTIAYALIQKYDPSVVNMYAIDFSSKMMSSFESAPHFGGVMYENDLDKINKFFNMMDCIIKERKELFKGGNYKQYVQVNGIKLPSIVIFIDNYASFKEKTNEIYEEQIIRLSKEGISHGVFLVISGAGYGINDITTRVGENINTVLCLSLQDKYAYGDYLHTMQIEVIPEGGVKGRGLAYYGSRILEYQTALSLKAENDYERLEAIRKICDEMSCNWQGKTARKVPEIPEKPVWSEFVKLDDFEELSKSSSLIPVGYDLSNAEIYSIDMFKNYCYLVTGLSRSGKTNYMRIVLQSVMMKKSNVCIIDGPAKSYRSFSNNPDITYADDEQSVFDFFSSLLPEFKRRNQMKNDLINDDKEEEEIFNVISKEIPYFIFISDLSWFVPFIYEATLDMRGFLENIISRGRLHNIYFIAEMDISKKAELSGYSLFDTFVSHKNGIHFGGKVSENPLFSFEYISYNDQIKKEKVGVGTLPDVTNESDTAKVVVPLARR